MGRRRHWPAWLLGIAVLAGAVHWLLGPAAPMPTDDQASESPGSGDPPALASYARRGSGTRLDEVIAWIRRHLGEPGDPQTPSTPFDPAPAPGPPGTLEVVVREEDGTGIPGTSIVVFGPPGTPIVPVGTTDAGGIAAFPGLPSGSAYDVHAILPGTDAWGDDPGTRRIEVRPGETTRMVLERPSLRLDGVVRDLASGEPAPGAEVEAFDVGDRLAARARDPRIGWTSTAFGSAERLARVGSGVTGTDGRFHIDAGALGHVELRARAPDGRAGTQLVDRSRARRPTDLTIRPPRRCSGILVDGDDRAQPGLRVPTPTPNGSPDDGSSATTDAGGRFSIPAYGRGASARLVVEGDRVPRFSVTVPTDRDARIVVPGRAVLDLRLLDAASGRPLGDAHLLAWVGSTTTEATTDAEGRARLATTGGPISLVRVFAAGLRELTLGSDGETPVRTEPVDALERPLGPAEVRSVIVRVPRGAVVVGRVLLPDGRPADRVSVRLAIGWSGGTPIARTGPDGRFLIAGCIAPPPSWTRGVHAYGEGGPQGTFGVEVPADAAALARGTIDLGDVVLRRGAVVRARVVDPDGAPIPTASAGGNVTARADAEGWLVMPMGADMLDPGASVVFDVAAPGFRTREVRCSAALGPGEARDLPPIRLERGPRVAARVLDAEGRPVAGCAVRWPWNGDRTPVRTDADGRATLSGAPSGTESVQVTLPDGARFARHGPLPPVAGDRIDLELPLPPTRTLVVRVVDAAGVPIALAGVSAPRTAASRGTLSAEEQGSSADATGYARLPSVVATSMRLRAHAPGFVTQEVPVDGAATSATVTLEAIGDASERRLAEVRASLDHLEREIRARDPDDEGEEARARFRRRQELQEERDRLRGR